MMEITAIPPTTPPAIAPVFDLWPTLEELGIVPGVSSGLSIKRSGVRTRSETREGKDNGEGAQCSPPTEYDSLGFHMFSF
jgi:hypothetical protein